MMPNAEADRSGETSTKETCHNDRPGEDPSDHNERGAKRSPIWSFVRSLKPDLNNLHPTDSEPVLPTDLQETPESSASVETMATSITSLDLSDRFDPELSCKPEEPSASTCIQIRPELKAIPTAIIDESSQQAWEIDIRPRLRDEVCRKLGRECQLQLCMVEERLGQTRPYILVICWDRRLSAAWRHRMTIERKLQKRVEKFQSLRECHFPVMVFLDQVRLVSLGINALRRKVQIVLPDCDQDADFQPAQVFCEDLSTAICSIGGFVSTEAGIFGLTAGHPFLNEDKDDTAHEKDDLACQEAEPSIFDEIFASLLQEDAALEDYLVTDKIISASSSTSRNTMSTLSDRFTEPVKVGPAIDSDNTLLETSEPHVSRLKCLQGTLLHLFNYAFTSDTDLDHCYHADWALIDVSAERSWKEMEMQARLTRVAVMTRITPGERVEVKLAGNKPLAGHLGQVHLELVLNGLQLKVAQIVLENPLEPGHSGSWVTVGDTVLGQIVASRRFAPIAYMVPMTSIIEDMQRKLKTNSIDLIKGNSVLQDLIRLRRSALPPRPGAGVLGSVSAKVQPPALEELSQPIPTRKGSGSSMLRLSSEDEFAKVVAASIVRPLEEDLSLLFGQPPFSLSVNQYASSSIRSDDTEIQGTEREPIPNQAISSPNSSLTRLTTVSRLILHHCNTPCIRKVTRSSNRNGNAGRRYFVCSECDKFVTWEDDIGLGDEVCLCDCGRACQPGITSQVNGRKFFYKCATGYCDFFKWQLDDSGNQVTVSEDVADALRTLRIV